MSQSHIASKERAKFCVELRCCAVDDVESGFFRRAQHSESLWCCVIVKSRGGCQVADSVVSTG